MSKRELIDRIRMLNPTAASSFLARFGEADLSQYLRNLTETVPLPSRGASLLPDETAVAQTAEDPRQLALAF